MERGVFDIVITQYALLEGSHPAGRKISMFKPVVAYFGTIRNIEDREDLILVTDQFEVDWILEYLGYPAKYYVDPKDFSGLFVSIKDGDYEEVLAFEGCVPYLFKDLWRIESQ
jgi:hypothetical protein